jgi:acyl-CoA synthetase (AMP-forming)/AMP-acid ligase II
VPRRSKVYAARHAREHAGRPAIVMAASGETVTLGEYEARSNSVALIKYCRAALAHFKCPKSVDFVADLPRTPTGKLLKRVLRDAYWQGHRTPIV